MANPPELGRLERLDELRDVWQTEDQDFTPWLAQDENISILGATLGLDLDVEAQEKGVGPFRADILCRETSGADHDSWVLIENQLEPTDHKHLGQLLTYAAGLRTVTIIWIAQRFTDEHRAALDWLNDITGERYQFFGLEVELWRIGDSLAAPKFNIVSKPNEWSREVGAAGASVARTSEGGALRRRYWAAFVDRLAELHPQFTKRKPPPDSWLGYSIGRSHFRLSLTVLDRSRQVSVSLNLEGTDRVSHYHLLAERREEIESAMGKALEWRPQRRTGQICLTWPEEAVLEAEADWPRQHQWLAETLEKFDRVFRSLVRDLDASDWVPEDIDEDE